MVVADAIEDFGERATQLIELAFCLVVSPKGWLDLPIGEPLLAVEVPQSEPVAPTSQVARAQDVVGGLWFTGEVEGVASGGLQARVDGRTDAEGAIECGDVATLILDRYAESSAVELLDRGSG